MDDPGIMSFILFPLEDTQGDSRNGRSRTWEARMLSGIEGEKAPCVRSTEKKVWLFVHFTGTTRKYNMSKKRRGCCLVF